MKAKKSGRPASLPRKPTKPVVKKKSKISIVRKKKSIPPSPKPKSNRWGVIPVVKKEK